MTDHLDTFAVRLVRKLIFFLEESNDTEPKHTPVPARHYQCFLDHNHVEEAKALLGNLEGIWHWQEAAGHLYPTIWTDEDGNCTDEMDAMLWQVVLNLICNRRA